MALRDRRLRDTESQCVRVDGVEVDVKARRDKSRRDGACRGWLDRHSQRHEKTQAAKTTNALRVPGALGAAARTYAQCMDKAPLATKAATSAAIFGASDACAQKLERVKEPDATRLLTTTAIGGLYFAPAARTRRGIARAEPRVDGVEVETPSTRPLDGVELRGGGRRA